MKYTIKKLAEIAGVSKRTLRYYDQIDLLKPNELNKSNYRIYNEKNVNQLQQILFYRALGFPLSKIKQIMNDPNFSRLEALKSQREMLIEQQSEINKLLTNINQTIKDYKGEVKMADSEKFEVFKKKQLETNELDYGEELREKYKKSTIEQVNEKYSQLDKNDFKNMKEIENNLIVNLLKLRKNPNSILEEKIYREHRQWLEYTWPNYTKEAHRGLVDMYLSDARFAKYYDDKAKVPVIRLLHDVIYHYTN